MSSSLTAWMSTRREFLHRFLAPLFAGAWPAELVEALRYPLGTGGKRVRPALCFAAYEATAATPDDLAPVLPAAAALELVHTYSLVHDDLPAMDDDDLRRGRPTVHVAFDPATAILVGDALLTEAFALLARADLPAPVRIALVGTLAEAAGYRGMVGGQAADIGVGGPITELEGTLAVHRGKTGRLLQAAVEAGGIVARATDAQREALAALGADLGLAFQLVDDIMDVDEDTGPNAARLLGVDATREQAEALVTRAVGAARTLPRPGALVDLARFVVERSH